jgi:dGTPase
MDKKILEKILKSNVLAETNNFSRYACLSKSGSRRYPQKEKIPDDKNIRPVFFHDTDRIIHSQAYARYIDKTQVFYLFENDHITHRVLHVQFVSKIGRVIGRALRLNEDLIEAIALGHDLGHVPYGHDGEKVLDRICQKHKIGCFAHNVQSARFLMDIENNGEGLNLSLQVLDGILAHNGEILGRKYEPDYDKTWDRFLTQYKRCFNQEGYSAKIFPMTLEGCIVRISDIIAYIGRDVEDAITLKLIKRSDVPAAIRKTLGASNDKIINTLVRDIINNSYDKPYLEFSEDIFKALRDLRNFNYSRIYLNPAIKTQNIKVERMFSMMFDMYYNDMVTKNQDSFAYRYYLRMNEHYRKVTLPKRAVIDFIAGMTDNFFNNQFKLQYVPQSYGYIYKT